jgi:protein-tyrosine phosphatase
MTLSDAKGIVKRILPYAALQLVRAHRDLARRERWLFWRSWFRRTLTTRQPQIYRGNGAPRSVLFVCRGNIIRSPMAAALLKQRLADLGANTMAVASVGLHARPGQGADPRALAVARQFGISLDDHRAQPLTIELVLHSDVIFVMDALIEAELIGRYPQARDKAFLLNSCARESSPHPIEIADPYDGDETDIHRCYELLQRSIRCLTFTFLPSVQRQ